MGNHLPLKLRIIHFLDLLHSQLDDCLGPILFVAGKGRNRQENLVSDFVATQIITYDIPFN